ncbi:MAG TPA: hypothetical protein VG826_16880 [Pirellulales bacterium]|nr:hypothetical protein [Pirellulales bacterium]
MSRWSLLLALLLLSAGCPNADGAFPGNGFWGIEPARKPHADASHAAVRHQARPHDIYPSSNPHFDNVSYGRGLTVGGGSAYQMNEYQGRGANLYYGYWDGGFNPGGLYSLSTYPHFDRPGFTYWQGGN